MTALVLFFVLIIFPIYHYGKIFRYTHKGLKETRETGTVVENPKLLKMSLGKVSSGIVSIPSTERTFEFTSPNLCDRRAGDEIEVLYYGENYDGIILAKEKKERRQIQYNNDRQRSFYVAIGYQPIRLMPAFSI